MKKHKEITYRIYDYLQVCKGRDKAIPAKSLAIIFFPEMSVANGRRAVREVINTIRNDNTFDNVIASCNKGYFWATKEEAGIANRRLFNQAFNLLKTAYMNEKKAAADGQMLLPLTPYQRQAVESLCEVKR